MLTIANLCAGYEDLPVLKDVSLTLPPGTISALLGPNGAGKSTLLKAVFGLVKITSGSIRSAGEELIGLPAYRLIAYGIVYVPQGKINFSTLSVRANLRLGAYTVKDKHVLQKKMSVVYDQFPVLKERSATLAFKLSGGQQQMLALGRALMQDPKLLLLDEPSLGLAPKLIKEIFQTIKNINRRLGTTILVVEHNIKSVLDIADFGFIMANGRIIAAGTTANLRRSDALRQVFVGELE